MALREQPYIPLYTKDFISDEKLRECSAESTGVYIMLICLLHKGEEYGKMTLREKDKKNDDNIANFAAKLTRQLPYDAECIHRALVDLIDNEVLTCEGDTIFQKRMVKDGALSEMRAKAGRKGAKSTHDKPATANEPAGDDNFAMAKSLAKGVANASANSLANTVVNSENENESDSEDANGDGNDKKEKVGETSEAKTNIAKALFSEFWSAYPKKRGKGAAEKAFLRIAPARELFGVMMASVGEAKASDEWQRDNGRYIPNPATWLNQRRWEDEYTPACHAPNVKTGGNGKKTVAEELDEFYNTVTEWAGESANDTG